MKLLPIGIQTFEKIIKNNNLYIDKTKYLYQLVQEGSVYFLSRPRRFGKSLTISTLASIFKGERELFKGLWIYESDYTWEKHPVIRLDMSSVSRYTGDVLDKVMITKLQEIADEYDIAVLKDNPPSICLEMLIRDLSKRHGKVVVLIDEYDKPILDHIKDRGTALYNREFLKDFYGVLKTQDEYIRFIFLTGVTKFSKVSVFSGLNNLKDITMDNRYGSMLGYTQEELENNFEEYIDDFVNKENISKDELLTKIRDWYNGFQFTGKTEKVYNPFSTLLMFDEKEFRNYWFETATPTFLIDLIKSQDYHIFETEGNEAAEETFSVFDIDRMNILSLLFQTGYFTIKKYNQDMELYTLGYPNREVEVAFTRNLISGLKGVQKEDIDRELILMQKALYEKKIKEFFEVFKTFISGLPYTVRSKDEEKYYQGLFYTVLRCFGINVKAEVTTNKGRIDAVIELKEKIYIIEFKLNGSKEDAIKQIIEKKYYEKYKNKDKEIILLGVEIDKKNKNVGDWVIGTPNYCK